MNSPLRWSRARGRMQGLLLSLLHLVCTGGFPLLVEIKAAPFKPANDELVLETLRTGPVDTKTRDLRALRKAHEANPVDVNIATRLAAALMERGQETADPRFLSYAEATLGPWWTLSDPPIQVLVLRATIHQSMHRFGPALGDLEQVLSRDPTHAQAWLTRATVLQVTGDYEGAGRALASLAALSPGLVTVASAASLASLTGGGSGAYQLLQKALTQSPRAPAAHRAWALTTMAEIAVSLGQDSEAREHFSAALALSKTDSYVLGAYADFLLDQNQASEVVTLLNDFSRMDGLLLRLARAEDRLRLPHASGHVADLRDRFDASARRGDTVHQREEAIYVLKLAKDPARALRLAENNWLVQKEPADARILLEAADAAGNTEAARPVLDWLTKNRVEDVRLQSLAAKIKSTPARHVP